MHKAKRRTVFGAGGSAHACMLPAKHGPRQIEHMPCCLWYSLFRLAQACRLLVNSLPEPLRM